MRAMILAAGEGRRMRPLTLSTPKPLLKVKNKALIQYPIEKLKANGISELVINTAYLAEQIEQKLGDGSALGLHIQYSREGKPLETGGALAKALPLLGEQPFVLVNGDVWCDHPLTFLNRLEASNSLAHLVLVPNPEHNPIGDFCIDQNAKLSRRKQGKEAYTFSGISLIHPDLIAQYPNKRECFPLLEVLHWAMDQGKVSGELHHGIWVDVGTPERLQFLNAI